jgi:hypothetical protein
MADMRKPLDINRVVKNKGDVIASDQRERSPGLAPANAIRAQ